MKGVRIICICAAVVASMGTLLATTSLAATTDAGELLLAAPFPTATPSQSPESLRAREVESMTARGIPAQRAGEDIQVEQAIAQAQLVRGLLRAMRGAYAGVWFQPAAARLAIGVTSQAGRQAAAQVLAQTGLARDVELVPVHSTWAALLAAQASWFHRVSDLFALGEAETGLAPEHNAVIVTLSSHAPSRELHALVREASTSAVKVLVSIVPRTQFQLKPAAETTCSLFMRNAAYCDKPITPGVSITSQNRVLCTAGPLVLPVGDKRLTYLLTAGHCLRRAGAGGKWSARTTGKTILEIGQQGAYLAGDPGDVGVIKVTTPGNWAEAGNTPVFAVTAEWKKDEQKSFPVQAERGPLVVNTENCIEGQTTGSKCSAIKAINLSARFPGYGTVLGLAEEWADIVSEGDSGGPVIAPTKGGYLVEGTVVGYRRLSPWETLWEPLETAFRELNAVHRLNLELLTTSNEERPTQTKAEKEAGETIEKEEGELRVSEKVQKEEEEAGEKEQKEEEEEAEKIEKERKENEAKEAKFNILSGEEFPLSLEATSGKKVESVFLQTEGGSKLLAESTTVLTNQYGLSSTGEIVIELKNAEEPSGKVKCNTEGDAEGVVLISGEYETVATNKTSSEAGLLVLFATSTLKCGTKVKVKLEEPLIVHLVTKGSGDVTEIGTTTHCKGTGKQELSSYFNSKAEEVTKQLLKANFGLGNEDACLEVKEELKLKLKSASTARMFTVLG
jgi:hypothetical protein